MPTVRQFEELNVWKAARALVNLVYEKTKNPQFSKDFALRDQIRKASISVMSNIAEGLDAGYDKEFIRFLGFSFRSASEVQSQLYTALDQGYIGAQEFDVVYGKAVDTKKQIRALVKYLSENQISGRIARETGPGYQTEEGIPFMAPILEIPDEYYSND